MPAETLSKLIPGSRKIEIESWNHLKNGWDSELSKKKTPNNSFGRFFFFSNHDMAIRPVDFLSFVIF